MVYGWKCGYEVSGIDANAVGEYLEKASKKHGKITAAQVVTDAKKRRHPLHNYFVWDDAKAASYYREVQAGRVIRAVVMVADEDAGASPRAFVNVVEEEEGAPERGYLPVAVALSKKETREYVLETARSELGAWRRRYAGLMELSRIFRVIDEIK